MYVYLHAAMDRPANETWKLLNNMNDSCCVVPEMNQYAYIADFAGHAARLEEALKFVTWISIKSEQGVDLPAWRFAQPAYKRQKNEKQFGRNIEDAFLYKRLYPSMEKSAGLEKEKSARVFQIYFSGRARGPL